FLDIAVQRRQPASDFPPSFRVEHGLRARRRAGCLVHLPGEQVKRVDGAMRMGQKNGQVGEPFAVLQMHRSSGEVQLPHSPLLSECPLELRPLPVTAGARGLHWSPQEFEHTSRKAAPIALPRSVATAFERAKGGPRNSRSKPSSALERYSHVVSPM